MRNIIIAVLVLIVTYTTPAHAPKQIVPTKAVKTVFNRKPIGELTLFLKHIGKIEGLGHYDIRGGYKGKYLGLYQFHPTTLHTLGIEVSDDEFLGNPQLQDSAMVLYMKDNAKDLRGIIKKYNNTYYNGVFVTKSGILAGAHLVGSVGIMSFFYPERFQYRTVDGNGVHVSQYIKKFANYNLRGI